MKYMTRDEFIKYGFESMVEAWVVAAEGVFDPAEVRELVLSVRTKDDVNIEGAKLYDALLEPIYRAKGMIPGDGGV